ncbi:MAG TPA: protein-tyrosine phosphatase family protein [Methylomirabilota bacterium]|nr:protein-tyrosine phosphatase family protein [Methylomirabilota bacterium]
MIEFLHPRLAGPGRLFAGSCPAAPYPAAAIALREAGVATVACLLERSALPAGLADAYAGNGLTLLRFPIDDMSVPPNAADFATFLEEIRTRLAAGEGVYLHCLAGVGRTGLALACLLVLAGEPAAAAVAAVRGYYRPEAVETEAQREFVEAFGPGR